MKILMVYPDYPATFWSYKYALNFVSKKSSYPPLGLLTVSSLLPGHFRKKLVDMNVHKLTDNDLDWADMIFISAMDIQKERTREVIERCRDKGKMTVGGGPLFTIQPEAFPDIDHLVLDEGEVTVPRFLEDLSRGTLKRVYSSKKRPDIRKTPVPDWSLINFKNYATILVQYSRGCPFKCEFCDVAILNGRTPRTKSSLQVLNELDSVYNLGYRGAIFFVDDNFIGNKKAVKEMLASLIEWQEKRDYPFTFLTEASVNLAEDQQLLEMMSLANFNKVFLGLETPSKESLTESGKLQNVNCDVEQAVRTIQHHGMEVMGGFILGFDSDIRPSVFNNLVQFIQNLGVVTAMVGLLNAIPQTPLWKRLAQEGRLLGDMSGSNTDATINFIPKMDRDKLINGYRNVLANIYSPRQYYQRVDIFLNNYNPRARTRIRFREIRALCKSIFKIGIFSRCCFHYWRLLIKTLLKKPRAFPVAVEMAIIGHHFRKLAKEVNRDRSL